MLPLCICDQGVVTKVATRGADLQKSESKQAQVESENEERSKT